MKYSVKPCASLAFCVYELLVLHRRNDEVHYIILRCYTQLKLIGTNNDDSFKFNFFEQNEDLRIAMSITQ
jgi:hypothetical protein